MSPPSASRWAVNGWNFNLEWTVLFKVAENFLFSSRTHWSLSEGEVISNAVVIGFHCTGMCDTMKSSIFDDVPLFLQWIGSFRDSFCAIKGLIIQRTFCANRSNLLLKRRISVARHLRRTKLILVRCSNNNVVQLIGALLQQICHKWHVRLLIHVEFTVFTFM